VLMKTMPLVLLAGVTLATACLTTSDRGDYDRAERSAYWELDGDNANLAPEEKLSPERESYRWQAEDWQAGRVKRANEETLILAPYLGGIGTIPLSLDADTPVFRGNALASRSELQPGVEVRANFHNDAHGFRRAVSVEILTPAAAARMRQKFEGSATRN
jgi:hypothetical protein